MNIPNFVQEKLVDEKGHLTDSWRLVITQLLNELQKNAGNEGLVSPSQPETTIANLTASQNGAMVYDSTNNAMKVNINGIFKTITVT